MYAAVRRSLSFLTRRQRITYFVIIISRGLAALLDVAGLALVGLIASFAAFQLDPATSKQPIVVHGISLPRIDLNGLFVLVLLVLGVFIFKAALAVFLSRRLAFFVARVEVENTQKIADHLLRGSLENVKRYSKAEFQYAITGSATSAFTGLLNNVATIFSEGFLLIAIVVAFMFVNVAAAFATMLYFATIVLLLQLLISGRLRLAGDDASIGTIDTINAISDTLDTFREIYVLGRQELFVERIRDSRERLARSNAAYAFLAGMPRYIVETALILGVVALVGQQLLAGDIGSGIVTLGIFLTGGVRIMAALLPLQTAVSAIRITSAQSIAALDLLVEIREDVEAQGLPPVGLEIDLPPQGLALSVRNASYRYPGDKKDVLKKISMEVAPGSYVAVIGPSGSGKTTTVDMILGLIEPDSGSVAIGGLAPNLVRRVAPGIVSYVPQRPGLVSGSIAENIALGIRPADIDQDLLRESVDAAHLREFLDTLPEGLDTSVGKQVDSLSGGQIQRIGLARALYGRPRLLILDEATSGLDAGTEAFVAATLRNLHNKVTVIVIAHRLSTVQHADNVYVVEKGRVTASGDFASVRAHVPMVAEYVKLMSFDQ